MSEVNTIAIIIETIKNIQLLDINDFTDGKYTLTESDVNELEILSAKYDALVTKCATAEINRVNLRDYLLKDYDMSDSFIDGVNDVIDNRSDNGNFDELENRIQDCECDIENKTDQDMVYDIVTDKLDDALDELRITRG
tara:strand:- start:1 stop:417 length:417 start_codon:yes stop_codon:yes gene_type:complete